MHWLRLRWLALGDSAGLILAIPPAILLGCLLIWLLPYTRQVGWDHYRLTATFQVDGVTVKTSQVYSYKCNSTSVRFAQSECLLRGEALPIDLGKYGKAFFVMNQWNADHTALAGEDYMVPRLIVAASHGGQVHNNNLPAMVRFRDLKNPQSVEFVDPNHLDATYGSGVSLTGFSIEKVTDLETTGEISRLLPWLDKATSALGKQGTASQLHTYDFKWPPK